MRYGTGPAAGCTSPSAVLPQTARSGAVGAPAAPAAPASACGAARRGAAAEHRLRDYGQSSPQGKAHRKTRRWASGGAYEQLVAARLAEAEAAAGGGRADACWQASAPAAHANASECAGRVCDRRESCRVLSEGQRHVPRLRPYRGRSCTCRTCGLSPPGGFEPESARRSRIPLSRSACVLFNRSRRDWGCVRGLWHIRGD